MAEVNLDDTIFLTDEDKKELMEIIKKVDQKVNQVKKEQKKLRDDVDINRRKKRNHALITVGANYVMEMTPEEKERVIEMTDEQIKSMIDEDRKKATIYKDIARDFLNGVNLDEFEKLSDEDRQKYIDSHKENNETNEAYALYKDIAGILVTEDEVDEYLNVSEEEREKELAELERIQRVKIYIADRWLKRLKPEIRNEMDSAVDGFEVEEIIKKYTEKKG